MKTKVAVITSLILAFAMILPACGDSTKTAEITLNIINAENLVPGTDYGAVNFCFTTEAGDEYQCVASGIGNAETLSDEASSAFAQNLGGAFAAGNKTSLTAPEGCDFIDAEKYGGKDNESRETGKPYGDANLCWAASVADMMTYGGWADSDEDGVMSELTANYFDDGSFQDTGIKFYLNGINPDQNCQEEPGSDSCRNAVFLNNEAAEGDFFASTQVRNPGKNGDKIVNTGHANNIAAEAVYEKMYASAEPALDMADSIVGAIDEGSSVGIQLVFYNEESRVGLHALTVFGYIRDAEGKLAALIIADSDSDVLWSREYLDSPEETLKDRQAYPDTYEMYLTGEFTHNETNYIELQDYEYSNSKMKYTNAVIHGLTILKSKEAAAEYAEGEPGDAANNPDIMAESAQFSELDTEFNVKAGEKVKVPFFISNISYKGYAANSKPCAKCRLIIYKDGEEYDRQSFDVPLTADSYTTGEANCSFNVSSSYVFKEAGEYTVDVEIEGICSETDGHELQDAFKGNNYLKNAATVNVSK